MARKKTFTLKLKRKQVNLGIGLVIAAALALLMLIPKVREAIAPIIPENISQKVGDFALIALGVLVLWTAAALAAVPVVPVVLAAIGAGLIVFSLVRMVGGDSLGPSIQKKKGDLTGAPIVSKFNQGGADAFNVLAPTGISPGANTNFTRDFDDTVTMVPVGNKGNEAGRMRREKTKGKRKAKPPPNVQREDDKQAARL